MRRTDGQRERERVRKRGKQRKRQKGCGITNDFSATFRHVDCPFLPQGLSGQGEQQPWKGLWNVLCISVAALTPLFLSFCQPVRRSARPERTRPDVVWSANTGCRLMALPGGGEKTSSKQGRARLSLFQLAAKGPAPMPMLPGSRGSPSWLAGAACVQYIGKYREMLKRERKSSGDVHHRMTANSMAATTRQRATRGVILQSRLVAWRERGG